MLTCCDVLVVLFVSGVLFFKKFFRYHLGCSSSCSSCWGGDTGAGVSGFLPPQFSSLLSLSLPLSLSELLSFSPSSLDELSSSTDMSLLVLSALHGKRTRVVSTNTYGTIDNATIVSVYIIIIIIIYRRVRAHAPVQNEYARVAAVEAYKNTTYLEELLVASEDITLVDVELRRILLSVGGDDDCCDSYTAEEWKKKIKYII